MCPIRGPPSGAAGPAGQGFHRRAPAGLLPEDAAPAGIREARPLRDESAQSPQAVMRHRLAVPEEATGSMASVGQSARALSQRRGA